MLVYGSMSLAEGLAMIRSKKGCQVNNEKRFVFLFVDRNYFIDRGEKIYNQIRRGKLYLRLVQGNFCYYVMPLKSHCQNDIVMSSTLSCFSLLL